MELPRFTCPEGSGAGEGNQGGQALHPGTTVDRVEGWPIGPDHPSHLVVAVKDVNHIAMGGPPHTRCNSLQLHGVQPLAPPVAQPASSSTGMPMHRKG